MKPLRYKKLQKSEILKISEIVLPTSLGQNISLKRRVSVRLAEKRVSFKKSKYQTRFTQFPLDSVNFKSFRLGNCAGKP